jgi:hypothetical protein
VRRSCPQGSGTFYAAFSGNASATLFADAGYAAFGLNFRDFTSGGADGLARYLRRVRAARPSGPAATVSNLELPAGDPLAGLLAPHTLVPLPGGRTLGVLSLTDPTHVTPNLPAYTGRFAPFDRALAVGLARLRRLAGGPPDVVAAVLTDVPSTAAEVAAAGSASAAKAAAVERLVDEAIGVDIFILGIGDAGVGEAHVRTNWAGDDVLVVPQRGGLQYGAALDNISATFSDEGRLVGNASGAAVVSLDCTVPEHAATAAVLEAYHDASEAILGGAFGTLAVPVDSPIQAAAAPELNATSPDALPAGCIVTVGGQAVCGCRVSSCEQGALYADAMMHAAGADAAIVNAGGIRSGLASGSVTRGDLVQMLPFGNEVVRATVSGATIRAALDHSISGLAGARSTPTLGFRPPGASHTAMPCSMITAVTVPCPHPLCLRSRHRASQA